LDKNPNYPWHALERGQFFFVPTLDIERTVLEGLVAALPYRYRDEPRYEIGIYKGKLGVKFFRTRPGRS
jgi:hypothetical protein